MKAKCLKSMNALLTFFLGLLGFSCSEREVAVLYGVPYAEINLETGVYASDSIETAVSFTDGDNHWYAGSDTITADFVLKKK